jgi:hypothetical protein
MSAAKDGALTPAYLAVGADGGSRPFYRGGVVVLEPEFSPGMALTE